MIWFWLASRNSVKWATGPLDRFFAFLCAQCGVSTHAMVRTNGFGAAGNLQLAMQRAQASADSFAYQAVSAAACPHCGALQPTFHQRFEHVRKKVARRLTMRVPAAAIVALLTLFVLAVPALRDLHHSVTLSAFAISAAAAMGALFFRFFSTHVLAPSTNPMGVWFSRDPSQGPGSWFPAQPGHAPAIPQAAKSTLVLSLVALLVSATSAIVAITLWHDTFRNVYVVSAEGEGHDLAIRLDDEPVVHATQLPGQDAPSATFEVRTSSHHRVAVIGNDGHELTYDLDPATAKHGWAIAPHAREQGLCLASLTWYYGTKPKEGNDALLGDGVDLVALPRSFDTVFTPPPATVQVDSGSSTTRTSLRALACTSLEHDAIVAFKNAPRPMPYVAP
jgi:hypothetical protein